MDDQKQTPDTGTDQGILYVRLAPDLKNRVKMCADREGVTVAELVRDMVAASFTPTGRRRKPRD